jgi:hypothetical protein
MRVKKSVYFLIFFLPFALTVLAFFLLFSPNANAAEHYIDKYANGANNGESWVDAWESFADISWESINPGDVIYISGGIASVVYYEHLVVATRGTEDNPVTIRNSYETEHNGRVILDGQDNTGTGIYIQGYDYVYIKGLEVRNYYNGIYLHREVDQVTIDSCIVSSCNERHIELRGQNSHAEGSGVDSTIIKNCTIVTDTDIPDQTDCIYAQDASNIVLQNNYIHMANVSLVNSHSDAIQAYRTRGWKIYNNIVIADSNAQGMALILGAESLTPTSDSVIIYNNYFYLGGIWYADAPWVAVGNTRWYSKNEMPPTFIIHNTFVSNGPYVEGFRFFYPAIFKNNIVAQYGDGSNHPSWRWNATLRNNNNSLSVNDLAHNLLWQEWNSEIFSGNYTGNGNTGTPNNWSDWVNTYGGTGVNLNPLFLNDVRERNGYVLKSNSPAGNKGENLQILIESMGFEWKDINDNYRDASPTIGAYEY